MTPEQKAAFVISQAACAMIEALGMVAENTDRTRHNYATAYAEDSFVDLIAKYRIRYNDVVGGLQS